MHLDLVATRQQEDRAGMLLPDHLEERGLAQADEAVDGAGRHDAHLALAADTSLAADLDEHLSLQDAENLVGRIMSVEVPHVIRRDGLNPHDEAAQPVLGPCNVSDLVTPARERHRDRTLLVPPLAA
jgi:hypothetical protein